MKWQCKESPGSSTIAEVTTGLRERYEVDDDGVFETPDDLDSATVRRLEEAGHELLEEETEDEPDPELEEDGDADEDDAEEEVDDEYADMSREELYAEYKERGGPVSWNDTSEDFLAAELRANDDGSDFSEPDET